MGCRSMSKSIIFLYLDAVQPIYSLDYCLFSTEFLRQWLPRGCRGLQLLGLLDVRNIDENLFEDFKAQLNPAAAVENSTAHIREMLYQAVADIQDTMNAINGKNAWNNSSCGSITDEHVDHVSKTLLPVSTELMEEVFGRATIVGYLPVAEPFSYIHEFENDAPANNISEINAVTASSVID